MTGFFPLDFLYLPLSSPPGFHTLTRLLGVLLASGAGIGHGSTTQILYRRVV